MTNLTVAVNTDKKTLKIAGKVAAGEHAKVTISSWTLGTDNLRIRLVDDHNGETLARFPLEDTDEWDGTSCELNLNTTQLAMRTIRGGFVATFYLEDVTDHILYGTGQIEVGQWIPLIGTDQPKNLDDFPGVVEKLQNTLNGALTALETATTAANTAATAASVATTKATNATTAANNATQAANNATGTANNLINSANTAVVQAQNSANTAATQASAASESATAAATSESKAKYYADLVNNIVGKEFATPVSYRQMLDILSYVIQKFGGTVGDDGTPYSPVDPPEAVYITGDDGEAHTIKVVKNGDENTLEVI